MRRTPLVIALTAAAVAVAGGGTAAASLDKAVTLSVDGEQTTAHTFGSTVADLLAGEGISIDEHDTVTPALDAPLEDGDRVAVRNGRLLTLSIDGEERKIWTTAQTVDEALDGLGVRGPGVVLSASRSKRIPLDGFSLELRTPKQVSVLVDGRTLAVTTSGLAVRDALADAKVRLAASDRVAPALGSRLGEGSVIRVSRVRTSLQRVSTDVPFTTVRRNDASLLTGTTKVRTEGREGSTAQVFRLTFIDGKLVTRRLVTERVTSAPVTEVVAVGTKPKPVAPKPAAPKPAAPKPSSGGSTSGGSSTPSAPRSATGVENLNWAALAQCESGGNPKAYNPAGPYYGLYQFSASTWASVGGSGIPSSASPSEQTYRAQLLYKRSGAGQWPHCGPRLFT